MERDAFGGYYRTTVLVEETDASKLDDLKALLCDHCDQGQLVY
ncbi:MAG: hypothetical protein OXO50_15330 [Caldilineaceae bacterium]|nr:hypothetical protein [Caldilineaceae bacterium]